MDARTLSARLAAVGARPACSDAERRAATIAATELRAAGLRPRVDTLWIRPRWGLTHAVHAAVAVAGSVLSVNHPILGLALTAGALVAAALDLAGVPLVALAFSRRATQNVTATVVEPPPGAGRVILTAALDTPRASLLERLERRRRRRLALRTGRLTALIPGPAGILLAALLGVTAGAAARVAGVEGIALGAAQLAPTVALILLFGAYLDAAAARPAPAAPATGPAVAIASAIALAARPPGGVGVELVLAGAGEAGALGLRAHVRARRRDLRAEQVALLHLGSAEGSPRWLRRDGTVVGVALHPRLAALAAEIARSERHLGAGPTEGRSVSGARVARGAGWPALALEGDAEPLQELVAALVARAASELRAAAPS